MTTPNWTSGNWITVRATRDEWGGRIKLLILNRNFDTGKRSAVQKIVFEELEEGSVINETVAIDKDAAQELMDQLWACHVRPTEQSMIAGALPATERHLEDMRRLVFNSEALKK